MTSPPQSPLVTPQDLMDDRVRSAWRLNLLVLSLDRTLPFVTDLGLDQDLVARSHPAMRAFVREHERWMASDDDAPVAPHMAPALSEMLTRVERDAGGQAVTMLRFFSEWVVAFGRIYTWRSPWYVLLIRLARRYTAEGLIDVYAIPVEKLQSVFAVATAFADRDDVLEEAFDAADALPLQGWDAEAYALYRVGGPELSPIDGLRRRAGDRLFETAWWAIVDLLTPAELDELERWGHAEVAVHMPTAGTARLPEAAKKRA